MIATRSQTSSTSLSRCELSSTATPRRAQLLEQLADDPPARPGRARWSARRAAAAAASRPAPGRSRAAAACPSTSPRPGAGGVGEPDQLEQLGPLGRAARRSRRAAGAGAAARRPSPAREAEELRQVAERGPRRSASRPDRRSTSTRPAARPHQAAGDLGQGRLAGAVRAEQPDQLARADLEVDAAPAPPAAVALAQGAERQGPPPLGRRLDLREERRHPLDALAARPRAEARPARGPSSPSAASSVSLRLRHVGDEQQRRHPQPLGEVVEDLVEALGVGLVLGQLPGLRLLDVAVEAPDQLPDLLQRLGQLGPVEQLADALGTTPSKSSASTASTAASGTTPSR